MSRASIKICLSAILIFLLITQTLHNAKADMATMGKQPSQEGYLQSHKTEDCSNIILVHTTTIVTRCVKKIAAVSAIKRNKVSYQSGRQR